MNTELIRHYLGIGATVLQRQGDEGLRSNVIPRLAQELRAEFDGQVGLVCSERDTPARSN
ncbi:hypothetical protein ABIC61_002567 [Curtobacterium sp. 1544]